MRLYQVDVIGVDPEHVTTCCKTSVLKILLHVTGVCDEDLDTCYRNVPGALGCESYKCARCTCTQILQVCPVHLDVNPTSVPGAFGRESYKCARCIWT